MQRLRRHNFVQNLNSDSTLTCGFDILDVLWPENS